MTTHAMLIRFITVGGLALAVACSDGGRTLRNLPTAATPTATGFVDPATTRFTTMATVLPSPHDALAFRQVLEAKFQALGKPLQNTYVNAEGVIVWTLEYLRYRASGCSQAEAIDKVFAQIDGKGIPAPCGGADAGYPPQTESLAFRQALEGKYRDQLNAPLSQTYIDQPSEILYTQEFVRYVQSGCSGASSYERVFAQIDGRGVEPDCRQTPPPCSYGISPPSQSAGAAGGAFSVSISAEPSECAWRLSADVPWIAAQTTTGSGSRTLGLTIGANAGAQSRSGRIALTGDDGTQATVLIEQAGQTTTPPGPTPPGPTPPTCTYTVAPLTVNIIPEGGTYDVQVTTQAGCAWNASSSVAWAPIASGSAGVGSGTIRFIVPKNADDEKRGTATVSYSTGSQTILLSQAAAYIRAVIVTNPECPIDTSCLFDGSLSKGMITSYQWDFGDGGTDTTAIATHTYDFGYVSDDPPDYSLDTPITLTVTGPAGQATTTVIIRVYDPNLGGGGLRRRRK